MSEIKYRDIVLDNAFSFKRAITENYIAQEFTANDISLYYWTYGRAAEIDFVIYNNDGIIPIEVKSRDNIRSTSLKFYVNENKPKYSIRLSTKNFGFENNIRAIPLYAAFCIK